MTNYYETIRQVKLGAKSAIKEAVTKSGVFDAERWAYNTSFDYPLPTKKILDVTKEVAKFSGLQYEDGKIFKFKVEVKENDA